MILGGFLGKISYEGDNLKEFLPLVFIGTLIHIGKGATFGLGRYERIVTFGLQFVLTIFL